MSSEQTLSWSLVGLSLSEVEMNCSSINYILLSLLVEHVISLIFLLTLKTLAGFINTLLFHFFGCAANCKKQILWKNTTCSIFLFLFCLWFYYDFNLALTIFIIYSAIVEYNEQLSVWDILMGKQNKISNSTKEMSCRNNKKLMMNR